MHPFPVVPKRGNGYKHFTVKDLRQVVPSGSRGWERRHDFDPFPRPGTGILVMGRQIEEPSNGWIHCAF